MIYPEFHYHAKAHKFLYRHSSSHKSCTFFLRGVWWEPMWQCGVVGVGHLQFNFMQVLTESCGTEPNSRVSPSVQNLLNLSFSMGKLQNVTTLHCLYCCQVPTETIRRSLLSTACCGWLLSFIAVTEHLGKWKWWCNEMYRKTCVGFLMQCSWCHCKSSYNDFTLITCSCYSRLFLSFCIKNTLFLKPL
jgi:hypothetical protein